MSEKQQGAPSEPAGGARTPKRLPLRKLMTRRRFAAWLAKKRPNAVAGVRENACDCPLARYLREKTGADYLSVGYWTDVGNETMTSPLWARQFIGRIDSSDVRRITVARARAALAAAQGGQGG